MSISDLPKKFRPLNLSPQEMVRLKAWVEKEGWTRQKSINKEFGYEESMPRNIIAEIKSIPVWGFFGKYVCVMCGYTTDATNVHRKCPEHPADDLASFPVMCFDHNIRHTLNNGVGTEKWTTHRDILMVKVS